MKKEFNNYVKKYDLSDEKIKVKYNHSFRVMKLSKKYAKKSNLNKEDIELAGIIGLLHDIGRFEQLKKYHTFDDLKSIDHADFSIIELFDNNKIEDFDINKEFYPIIKYAIQNHNKLFISKCDNQRAIMHTKLIRDIDKLDILYMLGYLGELNCYADDSPLSLEVIDAIKKHQSVDRKKIKSNNDRIVSQMAFIFDVNNDVVLKEIKKNLKYYYKRINDKKGILKDSYNEVIKYLEDRINKRKGMTIC